MTTVDIHHIRPGRGTQIFTEGFVSDDAQAQIAQQNLQRLKHEAGQGIYPRHYIGKNYATT